MRETQKGHKNGMKTVLLVMAAGIGSRFGGGVKQLTPVGPNGELIIDYSVHDAVEAGFDKIIFIIRKEIEADFKAIIGDRLANIYQVEYAYQDIYDLPDGFFVPEGRTKPWGTGQAVLSCRGLVDCPFAVINADDYYGKTALQLIHKFLIEHGSSKNSYCMAGFRLGSTLSNNGSVTRGICNLDTDGKLLGVAETRGIIKREEKAIIENTGKELNMASLVSMNMWGFTPDFFEILNRGFEEFLQGDNAMREYLLPDIVDELVQEKRVSVTVLETCDSWFGITYADDCRKAVTEFEKLTAAGVYHSPLHERRGVSNQPGVKSTNL